MDARVLRIESSVAKAVRRYLEYADEDAIPDLSEALARLLGWNWEMRGLVPPRTFEGLHRAEIKIPSPDELSVVGLMAPFAAD